MIHALIHAEIHEIHYWQAKSQKILRKHGKLKSPKTKSHTKQETNFSLSSSSDDQSESVSSIRQHIFDKQQSKNQDTQNNKHRVSVDGSQTHTSKAPDGRVEQSANRSNNSDNVQKPNHVCCIVL